jgi:hypothetical protein
MNRKIMYIRSAGGVVWIPSLQSIQYIYYKNTLQWLQKQQFITLEHFNKWKAVLRKANLYAKYLNLHYSALLHLYLIDTIDQLNTFQKGLNLISWVPDQRVCSMALVTSITLPLWGNFSLPQKLKHQKCLVLITQWWYITISYFLKPLLSSNLVGLWSNGRLSCPSWRSHCSIRDMFYSQD